jgi:hypothetical protein
MGAGTQQKAVFRDQLSSILHGALVGVLVHCGRPPIGKWQLD